MRVRQSLSVVDTASWSPSEDIQPGFVDVMHMGVLSDMDVNEPVQEEVFFFTSMRNEMKSKDKELLQKDYFKGKPENLTARCIEPCSFLEPGSSFYGTQNAHLEQPDEWRIRIMVEDINWDKGQLSGTMRAEGFVDSVEPILTVWEGEIIDNVNFTFRTSKWNAGLVVDKAHWAKFPELEDEMKTQQSKTHLSPFIYMRLKEKAFIKEPSCSCLTIAGFYYIQLCRQTGNMVGYYYDPNSTPYQRVDLKVEYNGTAGFVSGDCEML